jgi:hypothetical protein
LLVQVGDWPRATGLRIVDRYRDVLRYRDKLGKI